MFKEHTFIFVLIFVQILTVQPFDMREEPEAKTSISCIDCYGDTPDADCFLNPENTDVWDCSRSTHPRQNDLRCATSNGGINIFRGCINIMDDSIYQDCLKGLNGCTVCGNFLTGGNNCNNQPMEPYASN